MKLNYDIIHDGVGDRDYLSPILFLHAVTENRRTWKKVAPIISKKTGRKAYAVDARNHGDSPRSTEMDYDALTKDVVEFMDDHNIKRAIIIGHSMGGRTAIHFALKHPKRTEALIVEDMSPRNIKSGGRTFVSGIIDTIEEFLKSLPPELDLKAGKEVVLNCILDFSGEKFVRPEKILEHYDVDLMPINKIKDSFVTECELDAIKTWLKAEAHMEDLPGKNYSYDGGALFMFGDLGFFKLDTDPTVKKLFPRAITKRVKDASHFIHLDSPYDFADIVSDFILHRNLHESKL